MTRFGTAVSIVLLVTSVLFTQESVAPADAVAATARPAVNIPTVTGPVTGGQNRPSLITTTFDLGTVNYASTEYFVEGTATAYTSAQPLTADGRWSVTPQATAPYKTRLVVRRPATVSMSSSAARFTRACAVSSSCA